MNTFYSLIDWLLSLGKSGGGECQWTSIVESPLSVVIKPVFTGTQTGLEFTECVR
jgi:hypothetical protein